MAGYWNGPSLAPDAWFDTGDIGEIDARGCVHVHARRSDLIVTGGENVYPAEVERALEAMPGIRAAGVFGIASDEWGQEVAAALVASAAPPARLRARAPHRGAARAAQAATPLLLRARASAHRGRQARPQSRSPRAPRRCARSRCRATDFPAEGDAPQVREPLNRVARDCDGARIRDDASPQCADRARRSQRRANVSARGRRSSRTHPRRAFALEQACDERRLVVERPAEVGAEIAVRRETEMRDDPFRVELGFDVHTIVAPCGDRRGAARPRRRCSRHPSPRSARDNATSACSIVARRQLQGRANDCRSGGPTQPRSAASTALPRRAPRARAGSSARCPRSCR